jgi:hypothetical protein
VPDRRSRGRFPTVGARSATCAGPPDGSPGARGQGPGAVREREAWGSRRARSGRRRCRTSGTAWEGRCEGQRGRRWPAPRLPGPAWEHHGAPETGSVREPASWRPHRRSTRPGDPRAGPQGPHAREPEGPPAETWRPPHGPAWRPPPGDGRQGHVGELAARVVEVVRASLPCPPPGRTPAHRTTGSGSAPTPTWTTSDARRDRTRGRGRVHGAEGRRGRRRRHRTTRTACTRSWPSSPTRDRTSHT